MTEKRTVRVAIEFEVTINVTPPDHPTPGRLAIYTDDDCGKFECSTVLPEGATKLSARDYILNELDEHMSEYAPFGIDDYDSTVSVHRSPRK